MLGAVEIKSFGSAVFYNQKRHATVKSFRKPCTILNKLVLKPTGDTKGSSFDLSEGKLKVGAVAPADIVIDVATVSSNHATLEVSGSNVTITDTASTNGTFVDSKKLSPNQTEKLSVGSVVVFGDDKLAKFELIEEADPPPSPPPTPAPSETSNE